MASTATGGPVRPGPVVVRRALLMHQGVDFAAESGTPIHAAAAGTVTGARPNGGYGNWIEINHEDGLTTVYGHLSAFAARPHRRRVGANAASSSASSAPPAARPARTCISSCSTTACRPIPSSIRRSGGCRCAAAISARFRRLVARDLDEAQRDVDVGAP